MERLSRYNIATLLNLGCGIYRRAGKHRTDPNFSPQGAKTKDASARLVQMLADRSSEGEHCDLVALFVERPATLELGRMFVSSLERRWGRQIGILVVSREGWRTHFRYYESAADSRAADFARLGEEAVRSRVERKRVLLFSDLFSGEEHEGVLRMVAAPAARRHGVKVIGLATLAIGERGARQRLREATNNPRFPVFFLMHFGQDEPGKSEEKSGLKKGFLQSLFGHTAT